MVKKRAKKAKFKRTIKNLKYALKDETMATRFYPKAAKIARKEGFSAAARFFNATAKDERKHRAKIKKLLRKR